MKANIVIGFDGTEQQLNAAVEALRSEYDRTATVVSIRTVVFPEAVSEIKRTDEGLRAKVLASAPLEK